MAHRDLECAKLNHRGDWQEADDTYLYLYSPGGDMLTVAVCTLARLYTRLFALLREKSVTAIEGAEMRSLRVNIAGNI